MDTTGAWTIAACAAAAAIGAVIYLDVVADQARRLNSALNRLERHRGRQARRAAQAREAATQAEEILTAEAAPASAGRPRR